MIVYLDTNVLLARYAPEEIHHEQAKRLLSKIETGKLSAVTSVLSLVEVVCTTSRAYEKFNNTAEALGREAVAGAFLRRFLKIRKLRFIPIGGEISLKSTDEDRVEIPAIFALALEIGSKTGVKTLDAIHLASAAISGRLYGQKIDCFVTLDEDILKRREAINPLIESRITSLNEEF
ncbi:MAG: type II toxin-antitoxin system VapC family toxin [Candidatus Bathyarchaeia archaeon]